MTDRSPEALLERLLPGCKTDEARAALPAAIEVVTPYLNVWRDRHLPLVPKDEVDEQQLKSALTKATGTRVDELAFVSVSERPEWFSFFGRHTHLALAQTTAECLWGSWKKAKDGPPQNYTEWIHRATLFIFYDRDLQEILNEQMPDGLWLRMVGTGEKGTSLAAVNELVSTISRIYLLAVVLGHATQIERILPLLKLALSAPPFGLARDGTRRFAVLTA